MYIQNITIYIYIITMDIPYDLLNIVASYMVKPKMKLLDWIPEEKLNWDFLYLNPNLLNAIYFLEKYPDKIERIQSLKNHSDIQHYDNIDWYYLSRIRNLHAIHLLEQNLDKINWDVLSGNSNAIHLLEKYPEKINWEFLSMNPNAIHLLEKYPDKINWQNLSSNPNAIHLLETVLHCDPDKINWGFLSANSNAIHILEKNPEKIDWFWLLSNLNAMHILEKNLMKIDWNRLSLNPSIFEIDIKQMKIELTKKANNIDFYK